MAGTVNPFLQQLLEIHWLRPETALWRSFDCLLMEKFGEPFGVSADLGCGDGTMSFIMAGGKLKQYDVFMEVCRLQEFNSGADIYNRKTELPLDTDSGGLRYRYQFGIDHKDGLIDKARRFAPFYQETLVRDLNAELPLETGQLDSAFSNILYWLGDLDRTLTEWQRVLKQKGKLFLFVPNANFKEKASLYYSAPHQGERGYLNYLDRGYSSLIQHCYSYAKWSESFKRNGFEVADHHLYLTNPTMEIWNVGTRPIAPLLINMAGMLTPERRGEAKAEWVDYFARFFMPILEGEFERKVAETEAAFHFFVLEKK